MLDMKYIREYPDDVRRAITLKLIDLDLDELLSVDREASAIGQQIQMLREERNANAKAMPRATPAERPQLIERGRAISEELKTLEPGLRTVEERRYQLLLRVPQIPSPDAPIGESEADNVETKRWGEPPHFDFEPRDHIQLLEMHNWAELERAAQVAGSRSYILRNDMVLLEMALWRFALDHVYAKGFELLTVPSLVREFTLTGTGHFPSGRDQVYTIPTDDLFLSGTAEVPTNALHAGEVLNESDLPIAYASFSPAFRREAGSGGRDVRGLIRVHQFAKVEQYVMCVADPEESARWHATLLQNAEEMVQALELPYRLIEACTGDMGAGKVRMTDIECWVPSEGKYRETHSCSMLYDWQARRTNLRYRDTGGTVRFAHTLNNTALATPRILVPLLENHQQADGSIRLPSVLVPYMGGRTTLGAST